MIVYLHVWLDTFQCIYVVKTFFVEFVAVHNGIITNYKTLKHFLVSKDM